MLDGNQRMDERKGKDGWKERMEERMDGKKGWMEEKDGRKKLTYQTISPWFSIMGIPLTSVATTTTNSITVPFILI